MSLEVRSAAGGPLKVFVYFITKERSCKNSALKAVAEASDTAYGYQFSYKIKSCDVWV